MNRKERRAAERRGQVERIPRVGAATSGIRGADTSPIYAQAAWHWQIGERAQAEALLHKVLSTDPKHAASLYLMGVIAFLDRQPEVAIKWFSKAIASNSRNATYHNDIGLALAELGRLEEASACYRRAIKLEPDNGRSYYNIAMVLHAQGHSHEASAQYAMSLARAPERFETYGEIAATLQKFNPVVSAAIERATSSWPRLLSMDELFGSHGYPAVSGDLLLRFLQTSSLIFSVSIERLLTSVRAILLNSINDGGHFDEDESDLSFRCALARQCFINEYIYFATPEELSAAGQLKAKLVAALEMKSTVPPRTLAAVASYFSLNAIPNSQILLDSSACANWPVAIDELLTQQLREPAEERRIRALIPKLTPIENPTSLRVQKQYEESPYPRWILLPKRPTPTTIDDFFRSNFPAVSVRSVGSSGSADILIAGCGTGRNAILVAQSFKDANVLAIDLSLSSLSYAQRKSLESRIENITYTQADILNLGSTGRTFDLIDSLGVLHHLADPEAGWRSLLSLLRPNGVMRIGLYSKLARRDVIAARALFIERGVRPNAEDIRNARQELMKTQLVNVFRSADAYSTSNFRDLLLHVQEREFTLGEINSFLVENDLKFIGFQLNAAVSVDYRKRFPDDLALRDFRCWEDFENERPDTFMGMYQFWVQKL